MGAVALPITVLLVVPTVGHAWGFEAHRLVNERAAGTLPAPLRDLFEGNAPYLGAHSIDPDLWKIYRPDEDPNHYLNLDAFDDLASGAIPRSERAHLKRHGAEAAGHGRLPWRVGEVFGELVAAFRARDEAKALERAAVLGHYVADAHVALHAVVNYDGQLTGQDGLHARWESGLFLRFQEQIEAAVTPEEAGPRGDAVEATFSILQGSKKRAAEALAADRRAAGPRDFVETPEDDRYDDGYYSRLYANEGDRFAARLAAAATAVGSFWLTAWQRAGRPELDTSFRFHHVRGRSRLVVALLSGAGAELVDDAADRGALPHLDALRREGSAGRMTPPFPARPAAAQATLWTGAWPARHGIVGDGSPRPSDSVLETEAGARSTALGAEPLWVTAAREGVATVVVGVPQADPFEPFLEEKRFGGDFGHYLTLLRPEATGIEAAALAARDLSPRPAPEWRGAHPGATSREVQIALGSETLPGLLFDDPADPASGLDTLAFSSSRDLDGAAVLKPVPPERGEGALAAVAVETAEGRVFVHFRLFSLSPDGREMLLWHSAGARAAASRVRVEAAAVEEEGLLDEGAHRLYADGALGTPLWEGGDGTAERRYLETVRVAVRQHARHAAFVLERTRWGLVVLSLPFPAEPLRLWAGRLDPSRAGHDAALAVRLRPFLDEALRIMDTWVGEVARRIPGDAALVVLGDHGFGGIDRVARPNVALEAAGLLATHADGTIDLAQTRVVYAPANGGSLMVNRDSRPGGIQPRRGEPVTRAAAIRAMKAMSDPVTAEPVIAELVEPDRRGAPPGLGGPWGGFLYLRPAAGVTLSPETGGPAVEAIEVRGDAFDPGVPAVAALVVLAGRGVAGGRSLGEVAPIDVAPTLARLLGLAAPAQAEGKSIPRVLARDPAPDEAASDSR
jgi:hypothetical protein